MSGVGQSARQAGKPPIVALAIASLGAAVGALFPVAAILALGDIGAGLSASADDAAWIITVYNVGQLAAQPALMVLVGSVGRGRGMVIAGAMFALTSGAIALAPDLGWAIALRLLQGFFGGMLPTLMILLVMSSPLTGKRQVAGLAGFSIATAAAIGFAASVGAAILSLGGWRALFWLQAVVGAIYAGLAIFILRNERGDPRRILSADWESFLYLSTGLGLIAVALSEGERRFWFDTWWIGASLVSGVLCFCLAIRALPRGTPALVQLQLFQRPTVAWSLLLQVLYRVGAIVAVVVIPQYLFRIHGYRIEQLAEVFVPLGIATLVAAPGAYWLCMRIDARIPLCAGLALFALAASLCATLSPDWAAEQFILPMSLLGVGQALFGISTLRFATSGITREQGPSLGILFNYARVIGLVIGLALSTHLIVEQEKLHSATVVEYLSASRPELSQQILSRAASLQPKLNDPQISQRAATALVARNASVQAFTLAFADTFSALALLMLVAAVLTWGLPAIPNLIFSKTIIQPRSTP